jgi:hypothetical protein
MINSTKVRFFFQTTKKDFYEISKTIDRSTISRKIEFFKMADELSFNGSLSKQP